MWAILLASATAANFGGLRLRSSVSLMVTMSQKSSVPQAVKSVSQALMPDTGNRVTGAGAHTARCENIAKRRYTPEVGAVCPNWARTDLCGGRAVMRVPTAIIGPSLATALFG